jgi:hypothetical protein
MPKPIMKKKRKLKRPWLNAKLAGSVDKAIQEGKLKNPPLY